MPEVGESSVFKILFCLQHVCLTVCLLGFYYPQSDAFNSAPKLVMKLFKPLKLPLTLDIGTLMHWSIGALVDQYNKLHIEKACIHFSYHPNTKQKVQVSLRISLTIPIHFPALLDKNIVVCSVYINVFLCIVNYVYDILEK